jgi:hypothetical protein
LAEIPSRLVDLDVSGDGWHANLSRIERRKSVLFTHDATLVLGVRAGPQEAGRYAVEGLAQFPARA